MAKIGGNALLAGAAVSYISCIISFQTLLSTTLQNDAVSAAAASTVAFSAAVPAAAYCVGWAIANGGAATNACLYAFLSLASLRARESGFWASVTCSALAALVLFLGKLADGTDGRFHVVKSVMGSFLTSFVYAAAGSDLASAGCFLMVFSLAATLYSLDLAAPAAARVSCPGYDVIVRVVRLGCISAVVYLYTSWVLSYRDVVIEPPWKEVVGHILGVVGLLLAIAIVYSFERNGNVL